MGNDVSCDCGYGGNEFTDDELADLEEAVEDAEEDY